MKNSILSLIIILFIILSIISTSTYPKGLDFTKMRQEMVETQIKERGIKDDRVLSAMLKIERHRFVPKHLQALAYQDSPLPIGEGQTISQPYIVALMTESLELKPTDKVLEIGTGSGYQAAILAELAKEVYTIEIIEKLTKTAEERLKELGYRNTLVKCADGYLGWPEYAPFDCVIVTCASDHVPQPLIDQLAEGGRMVIPLGNPDYQELTLIRKKDGKLVSLQITGCIFVPMTGGH
jgi:protein-L-isoaspartate(D-aspartate) O-methyltransferase